MRNRTKRQFSAAILAAMIFSGSFPHSAISAEPRKPAVDLHRVELLYSEEDKLCRPLVRVYDRLSHRYPDAFGWEDLYASEFDAIGLKQPKPLNDRLHLPQMQIPRQAFYRLRFPGDREARLVYLEDFIVGDRGAFDSNIWIFKQGTDIDEGESSNPDINHFARYTVGLGALFAPDKIDTAIAWAGSPNIAPNYRLLSTPYYFLKIATQKGKSQITSYSRINKIAPFPGLTPGYLAIQRPFIFGSDIVIIAENKFEFLVYRFKSSQIDDVCYFGSVAYLNNLRKDGWIQKENKK